MSTVLLLCLLGLLVSFAVPITTRKTDREPEGFAFQIVISGAPGTIPFEQFKQALLTSGPILAYERQDAFEILIPGETHLQAVMELSKTPLSHQFTSYLHNELSTQEAEAMVFAEGFVQSNLPQPVLQAITNADSWETFHQTLSQLGLAPFVLVWPEITKQPLLAAVTEAN